MNPTSAASSSSGSVLQRSFSLGELLDLESFRDVCDSYASLFKIGFKIFDTSREMLVDVKGVGADFCAYLFSHSEGKSRCTRGVSKIRDIEFAEAKPEYHNCFSGLRYLISPITHEGTIIGKIVYGPYLPADIEPPDLSGLGEKFKPEISTRLLGTVRKVQDDVVRRVVRHLAQMIDVMMHVGYKHALVSRMHVEAVTASYTELQAKNQALQESFERLRELDRLKSNFLATVSHELRTPLTSVIGYSEMLLEGLAGPLSDEQVEYMSTIMEKGEQLLGLITGILDFSKIELGSLRLNTGPTNIVEIARSAVTTVMPIARKATVGIEFTTGGTIPSIEVDGDKIRQVLVNLIGNAVKFNQENGKVSVDVGACTRDVAESKEADLPAALSPQSEDFISIKIADTGLGIPQDKINRIFDSFYQVDGSSTREYGGTGLGLAIARSLIDAHEGRIEVESEHHQGSTFTVLLPIAREA